MTRLDGGNDGRVLRIRVYHFLNKSTTSSHCRKDYYSPVYCREDSAGVSFGGGLQSQIGLRTSIL